MGNAASVQRHESRELHALTGSLHKASKPPSMQLIPDAFTTVDQVTQGTALRRNGLESCNLIVGLDFTKSNEWSGKRTFGGHSLHDTDDASVPNPYEDVVESVGLTLRDFDEENCVHVFGFGDETTSDKCVFTFANDTTHAGLPFEAIRPRYREIVPNVVMAGPTSFAPLINQAVRIVNQTGRFHILVIVADGQVTRSEDIPARGVSKNEKETIDAIVCASNFPLSIVMVGVGDGPWESMIYFNNYLTNRKFDNFQFVEFHKIAAQASSRSQKLAQLSLQALMEVPEQYKTITRLGYQMKDPRQFKLDIPVVVVHPAPEPATPAVSVNAFGGSRTATQSTPTPATGNDNYGGNYSLATAPSPALDGSARPEHHVEMPPLHESAPFAPSAPPLDPGGGSMVLSDTHAMALTDRRSIGASHKASRAEMELSMLHELLLCCICEDRTKDTVFQCGHETCRLCASKVTKCPACRQDIEIRIRRYGV